MTGNDRELPRDFLFEEIRDGDDVPVALVLDGHLDPGHVPALITRLQDFHARARPQAELLDIPQGRVKYDADAPPRFAQHPGVQGWLVAGRAEDLPPGAEVLAERRGGKRMAVRVSRWVAARPVKRRDGDGERLWVMATFERLDQEE